MEMRNVYNCNRTSKQLLSTLKVSECRRGIEPKLLTSEKLLEMERPSRLLIIVECLELVYGTTYVDFGVEARRVVMSDLFRSTDCKAYI